MAIVYNGVTVAIGADGNAATATKLATARTINGVSFDGSENITIYDSTKAALASPAFTGTPTAPTASTGTNTTQLATTAYANAIAGGTTVPVTSKATNGYMKMANGMIIQWGIRTNGGVGYYDVTFPIAFPTSCVSVQTSFIRTSGAGDYRAVYGYASNTVARIATDGCDTYWMAIGY